jgi:hypothetical protein
MADTHAPQGPGPKDRFAWYEKLAVRAVLAGMVGVGAVGIAVESPIAAAGYLLFAGVGGVLVIYDFLCVYCPYPFQHSTCLFFPRELLTLVVKQRPGGIPWVRKVLFLLTAGGLVLVPQYWLWGNWAVMAGFWVLAALLGLAFPAYYCRRCRHAGCVLCRRAPASAETGESAPEV